MTRGEVKVFIASLHAISADLSSIDADVPKRVYAELQAMEKFLLDCECSTNS